jgi:hypothetical protein
MTENSARKDTNGVKIEWFDRHNGILSIAAIFIRCSPFLVSLRVAPAASLRLQCAVSAPQRAGKGKGQPQTDGRTNSGGTTDDTDDTRIDAHEEGAQGFSPLPSFRPPSSVR